MAEGNQDSMNHLEELVSIDGIGEVVARLFLDGAPHHGAALWIFPPCWI